MAFDLTDFIVKPAAPFAAGVVLFTVVWGFFKGVESVLTDDTKLEIAVWLLGVKVGQKVEPWPDTFAKVFDRVFGKRHFTWNCFWRSSVASLVVATGATAIVLHHRSSSALFILHEDRLDDTVRYLPLFMWFNILPDYLSLLETRLVIGVMKRIRSSFSTLLLLAVDLWLTAMVGYTATILAFQSLRIQFMSAILNPSATFWQNAVRLFRQEVFVHSQIVPNIWPTIKYVWHHPNPVVVIGRNDFELLWFYPALFTSIWLWLYAGSGFLLKFARHFDIGFDWFNRKFDIEKHPLSAIGLVAGCIVALLWWGFVLVKWLV